MGGSPATAIGPQADAKQDWPRLVAPYKETDALTAVSHLLQSLVLLALTWFLMLRALSLPYGVIFMLVLAAPAGALLVKIFAFQHDCGHGAPFKNAWANDLVGRSLSFLVLTPYRQWAREHAKHHATSGNLNYRGIGDVDTWTVAEFQAASPWARFWYRVYRHPLFLFGPGALGYFFIKQRFVWYSPKRLESWTSVWSTNACIAAFLYLMCRWVGAGRFFAVYVPSFLWASGLGTWIFYVGHQFGGSYFEDDRHWDFFDASMKGASYYDVPKILHYLSCNIGYHHIHHLCSKIPFYNLPRCHEENEQFQGRPLKLLESLSCATLALWDEKRKKMVRFDDLLA